MKQVNLKGQKFGRLTVVELVPSGPQHHGARWRCVCSCDATTVVFGHSLTSGKTQSCGCWQKQHGQRNVKNIAGQKFGRLTVIERAGSIRNGKRGVLATWIVRCDCGSIKTVRGGALRSATTRSCGCLHKERVSLSPGRALRNSVLANYKNNARIKQYEWALSEECFDGLIRSTCHYCGITPSTTITSKRHPGSFTYNGIDRKHNGEGYTDKNALPCCADCNKAKGAMSYDKFIAYLQRAGAFQLAQ
jgi:hypothetical protein